ncbi:MAG: hypothetical protein GXX91_09735 [Verrucomicrobiaceae bacterium]|nr:hypothetical protein [Verrucomicrobiaceae bacterium]
MIRSHFLSFACLLAAPTILPAQGESPAPAGAAFVPDRVELVPLPDHQVRFQIDGLEVTRWHYDPKYPRPFFYPFNGPSGSTLTRMGHPGASDHDHHRSIWFAHHKVEGLNFWADGTGTAIRQKRWFHYRDGDREAVMASLLGWYDAEGAEILEQDLVAATLPLEGGEHLLELQITMRPAGGRETVRLDQTNFGFLAVRVAKTLSHRFGGGQLTNSEGLVGEKAIFGQTARWMDYSGPVAFPAEGDGDGPGRATATEGITYFDHPENPRHPTAWHVRSDGWMGAAFCLGEGYTITDDAPLTLRYLLHAHAGDYDAERAAAVAGDFARRRGFEIDKAGVRRLDEKTVAGE